MKENLKTVLITAATTVFILALTGFAKTGTLAKPDLGSGAPTVVSYQGQVLLEGTAYDDDGYFKFAVVNEGGETFWSNDGSSESGSEPDSSVRLDVVKGLFNVLLGDDSIENMSEPLYPDVFADTERYLRVWFSPDGGESFYQLDPDRRIAAVPYALQAEEAAQAGNADTVDGYHGAALEESAEISADIAAHAAVADSHHSRYTDEEAWAAVLANDGPGSSLDSDTVDGEHASDLELPSGAMVLGETDNETTLINAGFSYAGRENAQIWSTKAAMPTGRNRLAATVVDGIIYAIGGQSVGANWQANEAYDPAIDSWTTKEDLPTGRINLVAAAVDGIIYAIGGSSSATQYETANEAYDPLIDSWSVKAPMPTGREDLAAVAVDGIIYAIGGKSSTTGWETTNEGYDPAFNTWNTKDPMPSGRSGLATTAVDGIIYAIGGYSSAMAYGTTNEAYDPAIDSWTTKEDLPTGRYWMEAAAVGGVVYTIGGVSEGSVRSDTNEAYDPVSDSWNTNVPMPTRRFSLAVVAVDETIYTIGGFSLAAAYETANEAYKPWLYVYRKP